VFFFTTIFSLLGPLYINDLPQIYEDVIIRIFNKTSLDIGSLYTIFSLPNLVMTPVGTFLLTYTGLGLGGVIFQMFNVIGALMINYGFVTYNYSFLFWGRAVNGLGCEVGMIIAATIADKWFSGRMLTFTQGMSRAICFLGQFLSLTIGASLFVKSRLINLAMFSYLVLCYLSFLMAVIYCISEHFFER